jgi:predicted dinucleotide-binding enzyme
MGGVPFAQWHAAHSDISVAAFAEAAASSDIIVNATNGTGSLDALAAAGAANLAGMVVVDIANPLDFSQGFPPSLNPVNTDSLGEQIQRAFPDARVVKTLNTMNASVMVDPASVAGGDHSVFVSGNDADAKTVVAGLLADLGHRDIIDLGDITTARGTEMLLPIWLRLWGAFGNADFNFKIAR